VVVGGRAYIVDCGPGVVRRAAAAFLKGVEALAPENRTRAFITHLHSDHTAGFPDLILTPWTLGRPEPLQVFGPPGLKSMTDHIVAAYSEDVDVRITGKEPAFDPASMVETTEVMPGLAYEDELVKITAFKVDHGAWKHAYGYKFETADRTIVISGDTTRTESIVEQCNGCDILLHEVYSTWGLGQRPPSWQAYHKSAHTSSAELADIASRARPGLLVLYHQLLWGATPEQLLAEIRQGYDGKVAFGNDLDIF
jgi:ribonuclease BN (tRNA processing enzyme)